MLCHRYEQGSAALVDEMDCYVTKLAKTPEGLDAAWEAANRTYETLQDARKACEQECRALLRALMVYGSETGRRRLMGTALTLSPETADRLSFGFLLNSELPPQAHEALPWIAEQLSSQIVDPSR